MEKTTRIENGKKVITLTYKSYFQEAIKPSKNNDGQIGIRLFYNSKNDCVKMAVGNVWIAVTASNEGYCKLSLSNANAGKGYIETDSTYRNNKASKLFEETEKFLNAKYSLSQKKFEWLKGLALKGQPLMTKKEAKTAKTAKTA